MICMWNFFCSEKREEMKNQNPELDAREITKKT